MTTHHHEETRMDDIETITDRAAIRDSDEADDRRAMPHSRACGIAPHDHGPRCSTNCPTCHGRPPLPKVDGLPGPGSSQTELADVRHLLRLRSDALARVSREAEALRAQVAAVEALADDRARHAYVAEKSRGYSVTHYGNPLVLVSDLRAALATTGEGK